MTLFVRPAAAAQIVLSLLLVTGIVPAGARWAAAQPAIAEEAGADEVLPLEPEESPPALAARSHDWRTPGFVSAVGGKIYDPACISLQSAGTNVPNLPFRPGVDENLEWMRLNGF